MKITVLKTQSGQRIFNLFYHRNGRCKLIAKFLTRKAVIEETERLNKNIEQNYSHFYSNDVNDKS